MARAFATLHGAGHLMGDVSGRNVLVSTQGTVRLIDTDSFQVRLGQQVYPCPVGTAEFTPPELQGQAFGTLIREVNHDRFGLAVLLFHLLFEGRHPYAGLHASGTTPSPAEAIALRAFAYALPPRPDLRSPPGTLRLNDLPDSLPRLFMQAFLPGDQARPAASEWESALAELQSQLVTCAQNPAHKHCRDRPCPWCRLNRLIQRASPVTARLLAAGRVDVRGELHRLWQRAQQVKAPPPPQLLHLLNAPAFVQPLALNLPARPPTPRRQIQQLNAARWLWRVTALMLLLGVTSWVQTRLVELVPLLVLLLGILIWSARFNYQRLLDAAGQYLNLENRLLGQFFPALRRWQDYQTQLQAVRDNLQMDLQSLLLAQALLEQRYQQESAHAEYQRAWQGLEERRQRLEHLLRQEQQAVQALTERYARRARAAYLQAQPIQPGCVPYLGAGLVAHLAAQGVATAYHLESACLDGIPAHWARMLLEWRHALEAFHTFDPRSVPQREVDDVRRVHQQQAVAELRALERDVQRFTQATWGLNEASLIAQLSDVKCRIQQHREALQRLEGL